MKYILILVLILTAAPVFAEEITLNTPEVLAVPTAAKIDWRTITINRDQKECGVVYRMLDASGLPIPKQNGQINRAWICRNVADNPLTEDVSCVAENDPWNCCTGLGTGDCDETDTCFNDVFGFLIRAQDVNTKIGIGLRNLLWNKMKGDAEVITPGNSGSFSD